MAVSVDFAPTLDRMATQVAVNQLVRAMTGAGADIKRELARAVKDGLDVSSMQSGVIRLRAQINDMEAEQLRLQREKLRYLSLEEAKRERVNELEAKGNALKEKGLELSAAQTAKYNELKNQLETYTAKREGAELGLAAVTTKLADGQKRLKDSSSDYAKSAAIAATATNALGASAAAGTVAIVGTVKAAGNFQQQMMKLHTAAGVSTADVKDLSDGILKMSSQVGYSSTQLSDAAFNVSKYGDLTNTTAKKLDIMKAAAQGANAEQADLTTTTDALLLSMHNFNVPAEKAADTMSKMVAAVGMTPGSLNEFAGALHNIEPIAANLGIKLEDLYGVLAQMGRSGTSMDQASEQMRNAMLALSDPAGPARAAMQQLGINGDEVSKKLGERGLSGTMEYLHDQIMKFGSEKSGIDVGELRQAAQAQENLNGMLAKMSPYARQNAEALKNNAEGSRAYTMAMRGANEEDKTQMDQARKLIDTIDGFSKRFANGRETIETVTQASKELTGTMSAEQVYLQTTGDHFKETSDAVNTLNNTTAEHDGTVKGFNETQETLNAKMRDAKAAFNAMAIEVGSAFIPVMTDVANVVKNIGELLSKHPGLLHAASDAVVTFGSMWAAIKAMNIATKIFGPVISAVGDLILKEESAIGTTSRLWNSLSKLGKFAGIAGLVSVGADIASDALPQGSGMQQAAGIAGDVAGWAGTGAMLGSVVPGIGTGAGALIGGGGALAYDLYQQFGGHAHGGPVYGRGPNGIDSVLTYLAPGEHVLTHHDVAAMGGHSNVHAFRNALHRATGGEIPGGGLDTHGAQVDTIAVAQAVQKLFGISNIGMYRSPDGFNEHSSGEAADVMVGNNAALGNQVASWVLNNASQFGVKYVLWRQRQWNPDGSSSMMQDRGGPTQNHMDHVHVRTAGGGFPAGGGPGANGVGSFPGGTSSVPAPAARGGFSLAGMMGGGGMGMGGASFSLGNMPAGSIAGFGSAGQPGYYSPAPAGAQVVNGPEGQPGYYTPVPERVDEKQRKVESLKNDIKVLEEKKGELTSKAKQSERDRLDNEIKTKNEQLREAEQKLKDAEQGEFHPLKFHAARQASASSRGRSGGRRGRERGGVEMPVQLGEGFGLDKGLPGLAEWAVGFLEDLVLGPLETAAMARMGGGEEGEEEGETALSGYSGGMGGMDVSGLAGGLSSALGGGSLSGYSGGVPSMADFKTVDVGGGNINISGTSGGPSGSSSGATVSSGSAIPAASTPTPAHFNDPWWKGSIGKPDMGTLGGLAPMEGATSGSPGPVTSLDGIAPQDPSSVAEAQRDKKNYKPQAMPPTGGKSTPGAVTNWNLLGDSPYTWGFGGSAVPPPFWSPLAQHNATGGPVGTDTVPAWLTPGEFVVNADATNKYLPMLKNMNGFSSGGMVPQYFDDGAKNPVQAAAVQPMPPKPPPNQAPAQPKAPPPSSGDNPKTVDAKPNPNLKTVDQAPSSDIHNLPGLTTPGAGSQQPGTGQAPSPGIGFGGGIIGMAEGAASSGASMSPAGPAAGAAMQTAFQFINRAASYGAQVAGIGVEALLESILPSSSAAGGDWSKTIPGKLLMGVTGIRPTNQNTAGNTPKIGEGSEGPQTTVGNQFYGDVHVNGVHNPDEFNSWSRQQSQSAVGAYPANTR